MFVISPNISKLMISGLTKEIARLNAINATCGDDWPDDYDPNDVAVYDSFRCYLEGNPGRNTIVQWETYSKGTAFSMALLPNFVRENLNSLSPEDIESACRIFAQYVAHRCTEMLENQEENTSKRKQVTYLLSQVIEFPGMSCPVFD